MSSNTFTKHAVKPLMNALIKFKKYFLGNDKPLTNKTLCQAKE